MDIKGTYDKDGQKIFEVGIGGRTIYIVAISYAEVEEKCNQKFKEMPYYINIKGTVLQ